MKMKEKLNIALFCHSLISDWNHGNVHFLRGLMRELAGQRRATTVRALGTLRFSPDGSTLAQAVDEAVLLWSIGARSVEAELPMEHRPNALAFLGEAGIPEGDLQAAEGRIMAAFVRARKPV